MADQLRRAAEADQPTAIYLLVVLTEQGAGVNATRYGAVGGRNVEQDLIIGESWLLRHMAKQSNQLTVWAVDAAVLLDKWIAYATAHRHPELTDQMI
jgi:hypothetical protein